MQTFIKHSQCVCSTLLVYDNKQLMCFCVVVLNEILANCEAVGTLTLYHDCMTDEQPSSTRTPEVIRFTDPLLNTGL